MPPEKIVVGRYELIEPLGRGGMGAVWLARDRLLGRDVALKEVSPPPGVDPVPLYARVMREARSAARLDHPGIVTVHDVVEEDGRPWIVMRYVRARSLDRVLAEDGPLSPAEAAVLGLQVLEALRVAHAAGVVHRDVKPANVMMEDGRAVLADFGIASLAGDPELTRDGALLGSPMYLSPEQARRQPATFMSDLWSLGATLYAAVEGRPPFARSDVIGVLAAVLTEEPDPPRRAGPLTPVLEGLLRKDPDARMRPDDAARLLSQAAGGHVPVGDVRLVRTDPGASPPGAPPQRDGGRRKLLPILAAASAALILASGTAFVVFSQKDGQPDPDRASQTLSSGTTGGSPSSSAALSTPVVRAGEKQHRNSVYAVVIPENWTVDGTAFLAPEAADGGRLGIVVETHARTPGVDLRRSLEDVASRSDYPGYQRVGDIRSLSQQGAQAYELEFTFRQNNRPARVRVRVFTFLDRFFQVMLLANEERWNEGLPVYERFLATLQGA